jgi:hypothetical protein
LGGHFGGFLAAFYPEMAKFAETAYGVTDNLAKEFIGNLHREY